MRISVELEQVWNTSGDLRRSASELKAVIEHLNKQMDKLSLEGGTDGSNMLANWEQVRRLSDQIQEQWIRLSGTLQAKSEAFSEADHSYHVEAESHFPKVSASAAALFRALGLNEEALILPGNYFSQGIISDPSSAVQSVWLVNERVNDFETPLVEGMSEASLTANYELKSENVVTIKDRLNCQQVLRSAAVNPQFWRFENPAAGL